MKSVLISIRPEWCELIVGGKKTIEVRKTKPKCETPFKCYIYMTAGNAVYPVTINGNPYICSNNGGKQVIGEFVCDRIIEFDAPGGLYRVTPNFIKKECCLSMPKLQEYGYDDKTNYYKNLYGWHISDLVIYKVQKELSEFKGRKLVWRGNNHIHEYKEITRPPQSWCYVEECEQK